MFPGYVYAFSMKEMSAGFDPEIPYNELPSLPPATDLETVRVLKAVIAAREQLATLNTACRLMPNPGIITSTIPLREAQASSEIENIVTTNDELFRAAWRVDVAPSPETKEALRYNGALHAAVASLDDRPISEQMAIQICSALQDSSAQIRSIPGTFIGNPATGNRIYTPPEGKDVILAHLSAWERFIYSDHGLDPLVLMAVTHYQFEAIHPFYDGNGRTGRILNILMLIQNDVLKLPVLYLSGYIVSTKSVYYRLLREVTSDGNWEDWIVYMINGVEEAARDAIQLIDDLRELQDVMESEIREVGGIAPVRELAELLLVNPYVRIQNLIDSGLVKRQTAATWLGKLAGAGVLSEVRVGREKIFINVKALDVLSQR